MNDTPHEHSESGVPKETRDSLRIPADSNRPEITDAELEAMLPTTPEVTDDEVEQLRASLRPPCPHCGPIYTDEELMRATYYVGTTLERIPGSTVYVNDEVLLVLNGNAMPVRPAVEGGFFIPIVHDTQNETPEGNHT